MKNYKFSIVIVTNNRLGILKNTIDKCVNQTYNVSEIIIIDNNSNDGTKEYLKTIARQYKNIIVKSMNNNVGGAGGFYEGMKIFYEQTTSDYVLLIDDDSYLEKNVIEELEKAITKYSCYWLACKVLWKNNEWSYMNIQPLATAKRKTVADVHSPQDLLIKNSTFVGSMFSRELVRKIGYPQKEYFIWGDDIEYTDRANRIAHGYFVSKAIIRHWSNNNNKPGDIASEDNIERLPRYQHEFKNRICTSRRRKSLFALIKTSCHILLDILKVIFKRHVKFRKQKLIIIFKSIFRSFKFNPKIEYPNMD